jgi:hypothetical protein
MPPTISTELFDALKAAGVSDEKARAAAAAVVAPDDKRFADVHALIKERFYHVDQRFDAMDRRFNAVELRLQAIEVRLGIVETKLTYHLWIMGVILALQVTILLKLFLA